MSTATPDTLSIDRHTSLYGTQSYTSPYGPPLLPIREESEVMQPETSRRRSYSTERNDIRPPSATEANRLDQIATHIQSLTYGEMMELATALWSKRENNSEVTEKELPGIWHRWSAK